MARQALTAQQIGALAAIDLLNDSLADGTIDRRLTTAIFEANNIIQDAFGVSFREHSTGPHKQRSLAQLYASTEIDRHYNELPFSGAVLQHPQHRLPNIDGLQARNGSLLQSPIKLNNGGGQQLPVSPFKVPQARMGVSDTFQTSPAQRRRTHTDDYATPDETPKRHDSGIEAYTLPTQANQQSRKRSHASTPPMSPGRKRVKSIVKFEDGATMPELAADADDRHENATSRRKESTTPRPTLVTAVSTSVTQAPPAFATPRRNTVGSMRGGNDSSASTQASPVHSDAELRRATLSEKGSSDPKGTLADEAKPAKIPSLGLARRTTVNLKSRARLPQLNTDGFYGNAPPSVKHAEKMNQAARQWKKKSKQGPNAPY